ncbi:unnamed protein product [Phytophthora fragariaefolia]|uniref:Unnamed protein product n=1 Tax=Phytophthora fragariaefolia TaxID=1490495 RepID=A0A9W7D1T5_9STRA|nr:unnamed protein product [Phytophthora fragariaefolia]
MEIPSGETRVLELRIGSCQDGALTAPPGSSSPRQASGRTAQPSSIGLAASDVDSAGGSSQPRRMLAQLRRARLNTLTPAEKLHRLSHLVSATAAGSRRKPHQPPDQPYSIPLPGEEGHEGVMELLAGDDLGAVSDGELLRLSAVSSRRQRHRCQASTSVTPSSAAKVVHPASAAGDEASFNFGPGDPMEDVELDVSVEVGVSVTSSTGAVSTTGTSSVVAATSSPVTATSSTTVTTVVSAAPTVDSAVENPARLPRTRRSSASAESSIPTSLPLVSSAAGLSAPCSTASTIGLASSAGLAVSPSILLLAPFPTSGVVTSAPSSADPVVASAPVLSSTLTSTPLSSTSLVASSTASSTVMSIPASSSAVITTTTTSLAAVALPAAGSVGVSTSAPGPGGSISMSTPNSAVLRVLACSRQTPALKPSGAVSTVVTAVPEVSSTSTRPMVPVSDSVMVPPSGRPRRKSAAIAASLSSHYLTEFRVSDRVALGLGGSAGSSSDSMSRGAGSSAKPLELLGGSSDAESDSVAARSVANESSRGQTGGPGYQATTVPHPKARALSPATPALDGDDSSDDSDDVSLRDLVSRMQTGCVATHGKAQSYLALGRALPSSPRSSDSTGVLSTQRSSSSPKKTKEKKERRKHKHRHKRKHKSKHRHKHKHRPSDLENSAGSAGDADPPRRSNRLASSDSAGCPRPSKNSRRDLPPSSSRLSNHSAGASPVVPSSLPSTTASVVVPPPPRSSLDSSFAGDFQGVVQYLSSVPVYPLVNLSWIPGGSDWCQAMSEVDSAEPWRTWWLTDPARHPYNACCRARNVDFLPFAPPGVDPNIVEAAVEDVVDLTEPDPPIRYTSAPPCANRAGIHIFEGCGPGELGWSASDSAATARSARDGSGDSPPDSIFGPDSPDLAGSLSSALGSSVGASSQASSSAGQRSRTGNSAGHPVQGQDSAMDMLVSAASAISQAPSPNAPVTL